MEPAAPLQRDHRPRRVLGGVLQELRRELQEIRPAVGEARRQAVGSARLPAAAAASSAGLVVVVVMVLVVMVAVRHHPPHQGGHGVLNFADHHRRSIDGGHGAISRRRGRGPGSFQEERLSPRPHLTAAGGVADWQASLAGWLAGLAAVPFLIHGAHTHARARTHTDDEALLARSLVCALRSGRFFFYMAASKQQGVTGDAPTEARTRESVKVNAEQCGVTVWTVQGSDM